MEALTPSSPPVDAVRLLLVEDNPVVARLVEALLEEVSEPRFAVETRTTLAEGLLSLSTRPADIVLLDLDLPDSRGLETVSRVVVRHPQIAVVVLTGHDDDGLGLDAVRRGAQDYLAKGRVDGILLARALRHAMERKDVEERLRMAAALDGLPGLPGRAWLVDRIRLALAHSGQEPDGIAIFHLDIDGLQRINDAHGHPAGDSVLRATAARLSGEVGPTDLVARLDDDEFLLYVEGVRDRRDASERGLRWITAVSAPHTLPDGSARVAVTCSVGAAVLGPDDLDVDAVLERVRTALAAAKRAGGNTAVVSS
jgi:diguanylate cyclase (GGDEF)-like protein